MKNYRFKIKMNKSQNDDRKKKNLDIDDRSVRGVKTEVYGTWKRWLKIFDSGGKPDAIVGLVADCVPQGPSFRMKSHYRRHFVSPWNILFRLYTAYLTNGELLRRDVAAASYIDRAGAGSWDVATSRPSQLIIQEQKLRLLRFVLRGRDPPKPRVVHFASLALANSRDYRIAVPSKSIISLFAVFETHSTSTYPIFIAFITEHRRQIITNCNEL